MPVGLCDVEHGCSLSPIRGATEAVPQKMKVNRWRSRLSTSTRSATTSIPVSAREYDRDVREHGGAVRARKLSDGGRPMVENVDPRAG